MNITGMKTSIQHVLLKIIPDLNLIKITHAKTTPKILPTSFDQQENDVQCQ